MSITIEGKVLSPVVVCFKAKKACFADYSALGARSLADLSNFPFTFYA
jgi:hypothetical protein